MTSRIVIKLFLKLTLLREDVFKKNKMRLLLNIDQEAWKGKGLCHVNCVELHLLI